MTIPFRCAARHKRDMKSKCGHAAFKNLSRIAISNCNSFQKRNKSKENRVGFRKEGRSPEWREATLSGVKLVSSGVNAVEIVVEQLFRGFVSQNLSRQTVDTVGEETDIFCGIVRYTLAFWNEPPQHMVVALAPCNLILNRFAYGI